MSTPGPVFSSLDKLIQITVKGREYSVPEGNMLLRALQYLAPDTIPYGRFCWNEDCQYCRVTYDLGEGTVPRVALSCKLMVKPGMRLVAMADEIKYCLRTLEAPPKDE